MYLVVPGTENIALLVLGPSSCAAGVEDLAGRRRHIMVRLSSAHIIRLLSDSADMSTK